MGSYYDSAEGVMLTRAECRAVAKIHCVPWNYIDDNWFDARRTKRHEKPEEGTIAHALKCDHIIYEVAAQTLLDWLGY